MLWLQRWKERYRIAYLVCDRFMVFFVLLPAVVIFWSSVWSVLDHYLGHHDKELLVWIYVAAGIFVLTLLNVTQYDLTKHFLLPHAAFRNIIIKRIYTAVAGCGNLFLWKGVWMAQDHYAGTTLGSALFSITIGAILLLCLRSSCNGIAVPLGTAFDEHHLFFIVPTRFRVKNDQRFLLLLDSLFSVAIVGTLVVFEWRGIWTLLDHLIYPDNLKLSVILSLIFGYTVCILVDMAQPVAVGFSAYLERANKWWLRLTFEATYLFIAKVAVLAAWRGIWISCDEVILKPDQVINIQNAWITVASVYVLASAMLHANSFFILEVNIDGGMADGQGCKVKVTVLDNYLEFWSQKSSVMVAGKRRKEKEVIAMMTTAEPTTVALRLTSDELGF